MRVCAVPSLTIERSQENALSRNFGRELTEIDDSVPSKPYTKRRVCGEVSLIAGSFVLVKPPIYTAS